MCVQTHDSICTAPKHFTIVSENGTATRFVYSTIILGQPAGLSQEACLHAGADWLRSSVNQWVARGQYKLY